MMYFMSGSNEELSAHPPVVSEYAQNKSNLQHSSVDKRDCGGSVIMVIDRTNEKVVYVALAILCCVIPHTVMSRLLLQATND